MRQRSRSEQKKAEEKKVTYDAIYWFKSVKEQSKRSKSNGSNAMVVTVTLFAVGIFMGVIKDSGMVEAMAETIVNALPAAIAPHMHWFMALFSVPLLMILGTDAFYYALLPDHYRRSTAVRHHARNGSGNLPLISHNGSSDQPVRCSSVRGPRSCRRLHQRAYPLLLRLVWPASIAVLILSTLVGVIQF